MDKVLTYRVENLIEHIDLVLSDTKNILFEELINDSIY